MDSVSLVAMASIIGAGLAMGIGSIGPGLGMGQAIGPGDGRDRPAAG